MVLGLSTQVLEDRLLPVSLHIIPVVDHTMSNGIVHAIAGCLRVREGLIADEEIEVFNPAFACEMSWLGRYGWSS